MIDRRTEDTDFNKTWSEYVNGFGALKDGNFKFIYLFIINLNLRSLARIRKYLLINQILENVNN